MQKLAENAWTAPAPLRFWGLQMNTRMVIVRLTGRRLVVISPVPGAEDLRSTLSGLGKVAAIVSPNLLHHLSLTEWAEAYPDAQVYAPAGLEDKRRDLSGMEVLGAGLDELLGEELQRFPVEGMPMLNESLFYHPSSATLVCTDFCLYMPKAEGVTKLFARAMKIHEQTNCDLLFRMMIRDKAAFRASLLPLRSLEIRHLTMCHHSVLSTRAGEALSEVLDQLQVPGG